VAGCPACRKRINTISQFLDHLANGAMPDLMEELIRRYRPENQADDGITRFRHS
jgi:hypothetical protein